MKHYQTEHSQQAEVMRWSRLAEGRFPELALLFAVPNGGMRNLHVARAMQAEGVKPGVPDLFLPVARRGFHGLFLEMKRAGAKPKSETARGPVSVEQARWIQALMLQGYRAEVCYGSAAAIDTLTEYLTIP
jgi:hypothetical protein